ncbi:hypothetical protein ABN09_13870 [Morganella morganii]|nr:hypothetical protein ABN09_13870 [Morganella morganii]
MLRLLLPFFSCPDVPPRKKSPQFSEKSIEECGRYLPDGIAYYVTIEGEVDLNKQFNGDINVTALQDSAPAVAF